MLEDAVLEEALARIVAELTGRPIEDVAGAMTMLGSIFVSLLELACLGRRWPFAVSLAALMLSYGGWSTIERSGSGDRTRSSERFCQPTSLIARVTYSTGQA